MRIENRGSGSWRVIISGGYDSSGKQVRLIRTVHADPKTTELSQRRFVEREAAKLEADFRRKLLSASNRVSMRDLYDDYVQARLIRRGLAPRTISDYKKIFEGEILPFFKTTSIQDLTPMDVNRFLKHLEQNGKKNYSRKYYQQLNEIGQYALHLGYISINPCSQVEAPKQAQKEAQTYEPEECRKIIAALNAYRLTEWRAFFMISLYTGMRPGEVIGLNWTDLDGDTITVQAGSVQLKGEHTKRTDRPKTKKSVRKILLPDVVVSALKLWKTKQATYRIQFGSAWPEPDAMFTNDLGNRIRSATPARRWTIFCKENGIRHLRLYDLRHTNASLMISQNLSVRDVSARLGHAQTSTTLNIYAHAFMDANQRATDAVMSALAVSDV